MAVPPRPPKGASKPWLKGQVDDLASLPTLDEETLLEELKCRYEDKRIYTYVGDILVAVNPFEPLGLYAPEYVNKYNDIVKSSAPPHIFAIADQAYHSLVRTNRDQCAVISGESGAGKTESAKYMIKQIINLCHVGAEGASLENKILQVNPLLEAFGNAKTLMNDNSSRFGKYTELKFNGRGIVVGGQISEYLLEKSRVVRQQEGERNFHIFYYIFASPEAASLGLRSPADFPYTNTTQTKIDGKTSEMYAELVKAMKDVGFSSDEQRNIQSILSAVLHLGKIEYQAIYSDNDPAQMASPDSLIQKLGELLKVDGASLKEALMVNITVTRGETIRRPYKIDQAYDCRDALAKALYGRLFGWIVANINALLSPGAAALAEQLREIGILDIFGFEHFRVNGFEQLCINVANEQLQSFFNQHIFKSELEEYAREGIDGNKISFVDNQGLLDFFFGRPIGLFSLLDEESLFPKGTDESFVAKLKTSVSGNPNIILPKTSDPTFGIQHYAGRVDYASAGFLERNRDNLAVDIITVCQSSKNTIISDTFLGEVTATGSVNPAKRDSRGRQQQQQDSPSKTETISKKRAATVGAQFLLSLKVLVEKMMRCNAHFVRCIKPNTTQSAKKFIPDFVQAQLRYTGMLETTRIRREGYSYRPLFESFMERFGLLAFGARSQIAPSAATCKKVLDVSGLQGWLMGKTKVFLKYWHVEQLDKQLRVFNERAETLQKVARGFVARKSVKKLKGNQKELTRQTFLFFDQMNRDLQQMLAKLEKSKKQDAHRKATGQAAKKPPPSASSGPVRPQKSEIELKRDASILWWQEKEMPRGAGQTASGDFQPWFHGLISRKESERLLATRNVGCFLVRVSENRFGYTLSYRISDRCNHYMVEQDTRGRYALVGVEKVSDTLNELIEYFQRNQINKDGDVLREPCGQEINEETGEEECDYGELLAPGTGFGSKAASRPPPVAAPAPPPVRRDSKPQLDMPAPGGPPPINRGAKPR